MMVVPLAEVMLELMKVLLSGCHDLDVEGSAWLPFCLAETFDKNGMLLESWSWAWEPGSGENGGGTGGSWIGVGSLVEMDFLTPFLKLLWWQLVEASSTGLTWFHQNRDLILGGYLTGAAELLQWPALKNDMVLLCNGMVKVCIVHMGTGIPAARPNNGYINRIIIQNYTDETYIVYWG